MLVGECVSRELSIIGDGKGGGLTSQQKSLTQLVGKILLNYYRNYVLEKH